MIKLLYAIAKAIPILKKILDKFFGEGREFSASKRLAAKDAAVDAAVNGVRKRKAEQQRKTDGASRVRGSSTGGSSIYNGSIKNDKRTGV